MNSVSGKTLELFRSANVYSAREFQEQALELVKSECHFDMASWGCGTFQPNTRTRYHSFSLHGIPSEIYRDFDRVAQHDGVSHEVIRRHGQSASYFNLQEQLSDARYAEYLAYTRRYDFNNICYVTRPSPIEGALNFISIYRRYPQDRFSGADAAAAQDLLMFAIEAGKINHDLAAATLAVSRASRQSVRAMVDKTGVVISSDLGFHDLIATQWPRHKPPFLPPELVSTLRDSRDHRYLGNRILASASIHADAWLVGVRDNSKMATLTPAQCQALAAVASGYSNKEAARLLKVSEATVRNHLTPAYATLEAMQVFDDMDGRSGGHRRRSHWKKTDLVRWWMELGV
jgi:DNA-binding NarL/FixJ family response regulator